MARRVDILRSVMAGASAPAIFGMLLIAAIASTFYVRDLRSAAEVRIERLAQIVVANASDAVIRDAHPEVATALSAFRAEPAIVAAAIYDDRGALLGTYVRAASPTYEVPSLPQRDALSWTTDLLWPVQIQQRTAGTIYVASDAAMLRPRLATYASILAASLAIGGAFVLLFVRRTRRRILHPLAELTSVVDRAAADRDYGLRSTSASRDDEIGALASRVNDVLGEMDERYRELRERRDHLEEDVAMRTTQLSATNALLTEAKNSAEEAARINAELHHKNQLILNAAAEGIFGVDAKGVVTFINPAAAEMLGWDAHELVGRPLHARIHPAAEEDRVQCPLCPAMVAAGPRALPRMATRSGSLPVEFTASDLRDGAGEIVGKVVTFRDVSERVAIEKMKDEFIATVSHELKTPLTSIRGALSLVASGSLGALGDKSQRMLHIALTNSDRLMRLVQDILDTERLTSGRVELRRAAIEIAPLLEEACAVMQPMADAAGVQLSIGESVDAVVDADGDRLMQTLTNLLSNAIKFSPSGGLVQLVAVPFGESVELRVIDQGRGIPAEKLGLVFERFRQVDLNDARDKGGSGLGLAICRGIIEAHGGSMHVESTIGEGSTFFVRLPTIESAVHFDAAVSNAAVQRT